MWAISLGARISTAFWKLYSYVTVRWKRYGVQHGRPASSTGWEIQTHHEPQGLFEHLAMVISQVTIITLYFVSSRERPWRHWARPRIYASRHIIYALIPVFLFECVRKHTNCARDDEHLPPEYALTSRLFLRWDNVYMVHSDMYLPWRSMK